MCGINGGWAPAGIASEVVQKSLDAMMHRGPDDSGMYLAGPVFLGNRRLSIIDLEGGHQPISNEDGSVIVVLNGEIYNYLELIPGLVSKGHHFRTKSDTEVLVHLYEDKGPEMCKDLRGMFAFAIWDATTQTLLCGSGSFRKETAVLHHDSRRPHFCLGIESASRAGARIRGAVVHPEPVDLRLSLFGLCPATGYGVQGRVCRSPGFLDAV